MHSAVRFEIPGERKVDKVFKQLVQEITVTFFEIVVTDGFFDEVEHCIIIMKFVKNGHDLHFSSLPHNAQFKTTKFPDVIPINPISSSKCRISNAIKLIPLWKAVHLMVLSCSVKIDQTNLDLWFGFVGTDRIGKMGRDGFQEVLAFTLDLQDHTVEIDSESVQGFHRTILAPYVRDAIGLSLTVGRTILYAIKGSKTARTPASS